ncbi:MAG: PAS domain S-box protein, partial [Bacteroidales bacterium]|nr:PAS domain S-box protein [Bacteroidales bacterium]
MISFDNPDELKELFKALLETSNAGMVIIKTNGSITANLAFYKMLGYSQGEVKAHEWRDLLLTDSIKECRENS